MVYRTMTRRMVSDDTLLNSFDLSLRDMLIHEKVSWIIRGAVSAAQIPMLLLKTSFKRRIQLMAVHNYACCV